MYSSSLHSSYSLTPEIVTSLSPPQEKLARAKTQAELVAKNTTPTRGPPRLRAPASPEEGGSELFDTMSRPPLFRPSTTILKEPGGGQSQIADGSYLPPSVTSTRVLKDPGGGTTQGEFFKSEITNASRIV
jgi:hypothetical protein